MAGTSAKSISERLAERALTGRTRRSLRNRAAFLAVRDDVLQALADGWSMQQIWEMLSEEGRIAFGYDWFRILVREANPKPERRAPLPSPRAVVPPQPNPVDAKASTAAPVPIIDRTEAPARPKQGIGATFVVSPTPSKKDLIGDD